VAQVVEVPGYCEVQVQTPVCQTKKVLGSSPLDWKVRMSREREYFSGTWQRTKSRYSTGSKISNRAGHQWLTPVILATQEAAIRRVIVRSQPGQTVRETLSQKNPLHKKGGGAGGVAQGVVPEPQYRGKKKDSDYSRSESVFGDEGGVENKIKWRSIVTYSKGIIYKCISSC
jgi:hypothetical protein